MRTVITYGTYDFLRIKQLNTLKKAKTLGDYLIVGVSSDCLNMQKGITCENKDTDRATIIEAIKYVDKVILETSLEQKKQDIIKYNVDVFLVGDDCKDNFDYLKDYCEVVYLSTISASAIK